MGEVASFIPKLREFATGERKNFKKEKLSFETSNILVGWKFPNIREWRFSRRESNQSNHKKVSCLRDSDGVIKAIILEQPSVEEFVKYYIISFPWTGKGLKFITSRRRIKQLMHSSDAFENQEISLCVRRD